MNRDTFQSVPKSARQYAAEIIALPNRSERRKALAMVPSGVRLCVKEYVEVHFNQQKANSRSHK